MLDSCADAGFGDGSCLHWPAKLHRLGGKGGLRGMHHADRLGSIGCSRQEDLKRNPIQVLGSELSVSPARVPQDQIPCCQTFEPISGKRIRVWRCAGLGGAPRWRCRKYHPPAHAEDVFVMVLSPCWGRVAANAESRSRVPRRLYSRAARLAPFPRQLLQRCAVRVAAAAHLLSTHRQTVVKSFAWVSDAAWVHR